MTRRVGAFHTSECLPTPKPARCAQSNALRTLPVSRLSSSYRLRPRFENVSGCLWQAAQRQYRALHHGGTASPIASPERGQQQLPLPPRLLWPTPTTRVQFQRMWDGLSPQSWPYF